MADDTEDQKTDGAEGTPAADGGDAAAQDVSGVGGPVDGQRELPYEILHQYIKDLSFENPVAAAGPDPDGPQPQVQVGVDVTTQKLEGRSVEVTLHIEAKASQGDTTIYILELAYAAHVRIGAIPKEALSALMYVEVPRYLFPFARQIVADTTRNGGFSMLLMAPFDFVQFYRRRIAAQQAAQDQDQAQTPAGTGEAAAETAETPENAG